MEPQTMEQMPKKKSVYDKERHEKNKEEIFNYRRERYRTIHKKDLNMKRVSTGAVQARRAYLMRSEPYIIIIISIISIVYYCFRK